MISWHRQKSLWASLRFVKIVVVLKGSRLYLKQTTNRVYETYWRDRPLRTAYIARLKWYCIRKIPHLVISFNVFTNLALEFKWWKQTVHQQVIASIFLPYMNDENLTRNILYLKWKEDKGEWKSSRLPCFPQGKMTSYIDYGRLPKLKIIPKVQP